MPSVQRVHEVFKASRVAVLAISIDGTGMQAAKPVIDAGKFTFAVPVDRDMAVARNFGVRGVPMTYVVDRKGAIVSQGFGPIDFDSSVFQEYVKAVAARGA